MNFGKISIKKYLLYGILIISLGFNVAVFYYDTIPFLYPKVKNKFLRDKTLSKVDEKTESLILNRAIDIVSSDNSVMVWTEPTGFTSSVLQRNDSRRNKKFTLYHYPRAFLYCGLIDYFIKQNNHEGLIEIKNSFDAFINFDISIVDQVPLGLAALKLYELDNDPKYITFSNKIYDFIIDIIEGDELISYRKGTKSVYCDMLGMAIPFLLKYSIATSNQDALNIASNQMSYYTKNGVDKYTYLPTHAIDRESKVKVGSTNWGRGIGWYFMALSHYYKETSEYEEEYFGLIDTLSKIKNSDGLWSQFPGSSDKFDASSTTMFLYSIALNNPSLYTKQSALELLKNHINMGGG